MLQWKRDGRQLATGRQLLVPASASADAGSYVCEALLSNSSGRPVEARAQLTVLGKGERGQWFLSQLWSIPAWGLLLVPPCIPGSMKLQGAESLPACF